MKTTIILIAIIGVIGCMNLNNLVYSQNIGINSTGTLPDASAMLDVSSTNKGLLIPRVSLTSTTDVVTIASPAASLLVYNTNAAMTGGSVGYWYWDGAQWAQLGAGGGSGWLLTGNAGTTAGTNFIGTTDAKDWVIKTNNAERMRILSGGNVGLGTTAPVEKLHVVGNIKIDANGVVNGSQSITMNTADGSDNTWLGISGGGAQNASNRGAYLNLFGNELSAFNLFGDVVLSTGQRSAGGAGGNMFFQTDQTLSPGAAASAARMTLLNNGNVGIGITNPTSRLHLSVADAATNTATDLLTIEHSTSGTVTDNFGSGILFNLEDETGTMRNAGRITSQWEVAGPTRLAGFRFTCDYGAAGCFNDKLVLRGNPSDGGFGLVSSELLFFGQAVSCTTITAAKIEARLTNWVTGPNYGGYLSFYTQTQDAASALTERMRINENGRVGIGTTNPGGQFELSLNEGRKPSSTAWTIPSDERLKNIEGVYAKGLKEILQLQPIIYHYKNAGERTFAPEVINALSIGFSAQAVQKIFPEAVGADEDGYLNFNIHAILIAYVNALKELADRNTKLVEAVGGQKKVIDDLVKEVIILKNGLGKPTQQKEISELKVMVEKLMQKEYAASKEK